MAEREHLVNDMLRRKQSFFKGPRANLVREGRRLARLLFSSHWDLTESQAKETSGILAETAERIEEILSV